MAPRIFFGVNLSFAKHVYGRKRALDIVRRRFGLHHAEMVGDDDFGPAFYIRSPEAFRQHHYEVREYAERQGVQLAGVFPFYRDTGAIAHSDPEIRESAYGVGLSLIEQAACYGAEYFGAPLFTMSQEAADDPERYQAQFFTALDIWKLWMTDARRLGVSALAIEMAAAYREGCSTIDDTRGTLEILHAFHAANPDTTSPVSLCYDTGHGISPTEHRDDVHREFGSWFEAFPGDIRVLHLKNTDPLFLEAWHLSREEGIIRARDVLGAVQETLTVPEVWVHLEVPGKRGREIGERRAIEGHIESIEIVHDALRDLGYTQDPGDHGWTPPG